MSKIYRNKKTSIAVISGKVKSVAPDRKSFILEGQEWDQANKKFVNKDIDVQGSFAFDDDIQVGGIATAVGYFNGPASIMAQSATVKSSNFEVQDLAVVSGMVVKCGYKNEINEDGTPRLKRDGSPRKPHYDVSVVVLDETDRRVYHNVKVYNFGQVEEGEKSNIDKIQGRLADFIDANETPTMITIVTTPGQERSWESQYNGQTYQNYACDHMGFKSVDINYLYDRQAVRGNAPQQQAPAPQPQSQQAPVAQAQPAPQQAQSYAQQAPQQQMPTYPQGGINYEQPAANVPTFGSMDVPEWNEDDFTR